MEHSYCSFMCPLLKDAFEKGKTIVLDEIDKSMHPSLVKFIMNLFRDPDVNKNGAQLIVTTHETGILSLEMFRPNIKSILQRKILKVV